MSRPKSEIATVRCFEMSQLLMCSVFTWSAVCCSGQILPQTTNETSLYRQITYSSNGTTYYGAEYVGHRACNNETEHKLQQTKTDAGLLAVQLQCSNQGFRLEPYTCLEHYHTVIVTSATIHQVNSYPLTFSRAVGMQIQRAPPAYHLYSHTLFQLCLCPSRVCISNQWHWAIIGRTQFNRASSKN